MKINSLLAIVSVFVAAVVSGCIQRIDESRAADESKAQSAADQDSDDQATRAKAELKSLMLGRDPVVSKIGRLLDEGKTEAARTLLTANESKLADDGMFQVQYARMLAVTVDVCTDEQELSESALKQIQNMRRRSRAAIELDGQLKSYAGRSLAQAVLDNLEQRIEQGAALLRSQHDDSWVIGRMPGCWLKELPLYATWNPEVANMVKKSMSRIAAVALRNGSPVSSVVARYLSVNPLALYFDDQNEQVLRFNVLTDNASADGVLDQLQKVSAACQAGKVEISSLITAMHAAGELIGSAMARRIAMQDRRLVDCQRCLFKTAKGENRVRFAYWLNNQAWSMCKSPKTSREQALIAERIARQAVKLLPDVPIADAENAGAEAVMQAMFGQPDRVRLFYAHTNIGNTLGVALYRGGKLKQAVEEFERIIPFDQALDHPFVRLMLSDGENVSDQGRWLNLVCLFMCKLRMDPSADGEGVFEKLPRPADADSTYADFYAEAAAMVKS